MFVRINGAVVRMRSTVVELGRMQEKLAGLFGRLLRREYYATDDEKLWMDGFLRHGGQNTKGMQPLDKFGRRGFSLAIFNKLDYSNTLKHWWVHWHVDPATFCLSLRLPFCISVVLGNGSQFGQILDPLENVNFPLPGRRSNSSSNLIDD